MSVDETRMVYREKERQLMRQKLSINKNTNDIERVRKVLESRVAVPSAKRSAKDTLPSRYASPSSSAINPSPMYSVDVSRNLLSSLRWAPWIASWKSQHSRDDCMCNRMTALLDTKYHFPAHAKIPLPSYIRRKRCHVSAPMPTSAAIVGYEGVHQQYSCGRLSWMGTRHIQRVYCRSNYSFPPGNMRAGMHAVTDSQWLLRCAALVLYSTGFPSRRRKDGCACGVAGNRIAVRYYVERRGRRQSFSRQILKDEG